MHRIADTVPRKGAVLILVVLGVLLLLPGPALAASTTGKAAWSELSPVENSTTANAGPLIKVRVTEPAYNLRTAKMTVDGATVKATLQYVSGSTKSAYVSCTPATPLADGPHRAYAEVTNANLQRSSVTWYFWVAQPPVITSLSPASGSVATSDMPTIRVTATDNGNLGSAEVGIDGGSPISMSLVAGTATVTLTTPLAKGLYHTAAVTVKDASGNAASVSTTFYVPVRTPMSGAFTCTQCHTTYPAVHPIDDCDLCHGSDSPIGSSYDYSPDMGHEPGTSCSDCHGDLTDCARCHGLAYPGVPALHVVPSHESTQFDSASCGASGCHEAWLTVEHSRNGLTCITCHNSTDTAVLAAITANNTACAACHATADHEAAHVQAAPNPACSTSTCHADNLFSEHLDNPALSCATCHSSTDTAVLAAITANNTACAACHATADHEAAHVQAAPNPACSTSTCHADNLFSEHLDNPALSCATCHNSTDTAVLAAITANNTACAACHATADHEAAHVQAAPNPACSTSTCHAANLFSEHLDNPALSCATCHSSTETAVLAAITANNTACAACHDLSAGHPYPAALHQATVSAVAVSGILTDQDGTPFTFYGGTTQTYGGQQCGQCHVMDLLQEHTKPSSSIAGLQCAGCHGAGKPRSSFADWNSTCGQGECHPAYHASMAVKHDTSYSGRAGTCGAADSGCHEIDQRPADLAAVHNEAWNGGGIFADLSGYPNGCRICHTSNTAVPATPTACNACHTSQHGAAVFP